MTKALTKQPGLELAGERWACSPQATLLVDLGLMGALGGTLTPTF
jgi:hypothetical protein